MDESGGSAESVMASMRERWQRGKMTEATGGIQRLRQPSTIRPSLPLSPRIQAKRRHHNEAKRFWLG
ncbi:hypothetical protein Rmet_6585 [Cupriavidus metallidurans CH34]|uniref:Uncharacterized protein n=1 Tax=Cupriavidus metallidurans (strain ATCC 43123 / DSM 2839 / NBRC 102507 / CH34) TaxID=266264 RepID=D3DY16_CUPMC|nr:hypothetical protein Rmet_6585 [Cupriavidus metallidurans CH34]